MADREALRQKINALPWFHQIDFGDGLLSPGAKKIDLLRAEAEIYFDEPLQRLTFLDIGCWDGFNSFEASRRGAQRMLATDHFVRTDPKNIGSRESFELGRKYLAPNVEVLDIDIPELTPERIGTFDIVLFCGVFYHLRNPFLALEQIARLVKRTLIVETHLDALDINRPAMILYPANELANDPTMALSAVNASRTAD
jgi:tRNA (mo5U34)-methyltransferase